MAENSNSTEFEIAEELATRTIKPSVARADVDRVSVEQSLKDTIWLEEWQSLDHDQKERTKELVRAILLHRAEVTRNHHPITYKQKDCESDLNLAGNHLATGGTGEIASALIETVKARLDKEEEYNEHRRRQYFSGRAIKMLVIGIVVQGLMLAAILGSLKFIEGEAGVPNMVLGVKTLSLFAVVVSGIVGSLARLVHESQSGLAAEETLQNFLSMAATSAARPLLAAVLALFVFALFQAGLIGIPFESSNQQNLSKFAREDFFFVAIAFVIGFNDTLELKLLAFVSKYLPDQKVGGQTGVGPGPSPEEKAAGSSPHS